MRNQLPDGIAVENVHRGHTRNSKHYLNHNHNHNHARNQIRKRLEGGGTAVEQATAVTTVIATVSYIQQIDVDANGSTYSTQRILTNAPPNASGAAPATTTSSSSSTASSTASSFNSGPSLISSGASALGTQSLQAASSTSLSSTSTPSTSPSVTSTIPPSGTFASISVSNSTISTLISSSSSSDSSTLSNSTTFLTSSTSISFPSSSFTFTSSASSPFPSSFTSSLSSTPPTSPSTSLSSYSSVQTTLAGGGAGGGSSGAPSSASPSSTAGAGSSSSSDSSAPPTSVVVGSVIGSVAGFAFIILLILALVKRRKRKNMLSLGNGNEGAGSTARELPSIQPEPSTAMTQRRSIAFAVPSALAALTGISKRASQRTDRTASSTAGSERGFYRVSGRKLPSVLQTGGDGYGGGIPESNTMSMSGSSFYRDSTGHYGGPGPSFGHSSGSPLGMVPPVGVGTDRDSGVPVMRPSPARTPVTEHGPFGPLPPSTSLEPPRRPNQPDGLGRSHPSQDGSHASRFTEEV